MTICTPAPSCYKNPLNREVRLFARHLVISFQTVQCLLDVPQVHLSQILFQHLVRLGVLDQLRPQMTTMSSHLRAGVHHHLAALHHHHLLQLLGAPHEPLCPQPEMWGVMTRQVTNNSPAECIALWATKTQNKNIKDWYNKILLRFCPVEKVLHGL